MGQKITSRNMALPFTFTTTTAAAAAAARLAGPLTMAQVVAVLFRIKKVRIVGDISHDLTIDPPPEEAPFTEPTTTAVDFVAARQKEEDGDYIDATKEADLLVQSEVSCRFSESTFWGFDGGVFGIKKDEAGSYWWNLAVSNGEGLREGDGGEFLSGLGETGDFLFDGVLTIAGEDITIPMIAFGLNVTAAECTVTVEEWWPYATTTGAAAWNTTTGAAINGGPGA